MPDAFFFFLLVPGADLVLQNSSWCEGAGHHSYLATDNLSYVSVTLYEIVMVRSASIDKELGNIGAFLRSYSVVGSS